MPIRKLTTKAEVIDALFKSGAIKGSSANKAFAEFISSEGKRRGDQHVSNYRNDVTKCFPPDTFLLVTKALEKIHCSAPSSLWGIPDPKDFKRAG